MYYVFGRLVRGVVCMYTGGMVITEACTSYLERGSQQFAVSCAEATLDATY